MVDAAHELALKPVVTSKLVFVVNDRTSKLAADIEMGGAIIGSGTDASKCKVTGILSYAGDGVLNVGQAATFDLTTYLYDGKASTEGGDKVEVSQSHHRNASHLPKDARFLWWHFIKRRFAASLLRTIERRMQAPSPSLPPPHVDRWHAIPFLH